MAVLCIGLPAGLHAANVAPATVLPTPPEAVPHVVHITDEQDRLMDGHLAAAAEKRSKADALFAEAMLLPDGAASDQQKAADLFRQVLALDPTFTDAQVKLANILLQSGQLDQALVQLKSALSAHPEAIQLQVALGYAQRLRGANEDALRICTRALNADPSQNVAMRVILEIAGDQNDLAGGVVHVEDILKAQGSKIGASPWLNLARIYLEIARSEVHPPDSDVVLKTRLPILQAAAAKSPETVDTLSLLADTYTSLGRKTDALKILREAATLEPSNIDTILHIADIESDLHQKTEAIKDYEKAYALNPGQPELREILGNLYLDQKRFADGARMFEEALADAPGNPAIEIDLGIAYEQAGQSAKAQECFQHIFESVACPPEAYIKLAFFQLEHKEVKEAGQTLATAQSHYPQSIPILYYQAVQHRYEKNYDAALASLEQVRALSTGPGATSALDASYYIETATNLNLSGQKKRFEDVLQDGMKHFPDNPSLMNELAYFWADEGNHLSEALALSRHAAAIEPDNGAILDTWGWVYFQMGQAKDALPYLQRAAIMTNNDPVVLQHVGDAYLKLGLRREAIATWTRALEKDPRNGDLANRIDAAQAQAKNAHSRSAPNP